MQPPPSPQVLLAQWIAANQARIDAAVLEALRNVDGVSNALMDPDAEGAERTRQKVDGLLNAARAVLPETMGESFERHFAGESAPLRTALKEQAESICRDQLQTYIDALVDQYGPQE
jgi:hypothetical protein